MSTELPPGYQDCLAKMYSRARAWSLVCGLDGLRFTLPPLKMMVIAPLTDQVIAMLGANEKTRQLLRELDEATDHEATVAMTCTIVRACGFPVEDWSEAYCATLVSRGGIPS